MVEGDRGRLRIGDLILDQNELRLTRDSVELPLKGLTFDLMVLLAQRAPAIVLHDDILNALWPDTLVGEETLKQRVRLLRRALDDDPREPRYIKTIRGRGYQLIVPVSPLVETRTTAPPKPARRSWFWLAPTLLLLAVLGWFLRSPVDEPAPVGAAGGVLQVDVMTARAYEYYQRFLPSENNKAINLLQETLKRDPNYAPAYALLSRALSQQPKMGAGYFGPEALEAAQTAIKLNPELVDGWLALGLYHDVSGNPSEGNRAYERALALEPNNGPAIANMAYNKMNMGLLNEALAWNQRALEIMPEIYFGMIQQGQILTLLGLPEEAESWYRKALLLQPENSFGRLDYANLLKAQDRLDEARALLAVHEELAWGGALAKNGLGDIHAHEGNLDAAAAVFGETAAEGNAYGRYRLLIVDHLRARAGVRERLLELEAQLADQLEHTPTHLRRAAVAAALGQSERALDHLERAFASGFRNTTDLRQDIAFQSLKTHPRFIRMCTDNDTLVADMRAKVMKEMKRGQRSH